MNAIEGTTSKSMCTCFPSKPLGNLHLIHTKAALLNNTCYVWERKRPKNKSKIKWIKRYLLKRLNYIDFFQMICIDKARYGGSACINQKIPDPMSKAWSQKRPPLVSWPIWLGVCQIQEVRSYQTQRGVVSCNLCLEISKEENKYVCNFLSQKMFIPGKNNCL